MASPYHNAEGHHPANDHPKWSQSYYFNFFDPSNGVGGFLRIGVLENLRQSNAWVVLFMGGRPAYNRICAASLYTSDRMDTGIEVAGLRFSAVVPLQTARLGFSDDDLAMDLMFESIHPMADAIAMARNEAGALLQTIAAAHLEGPGTVRGTLNLRGSRIDVNGTGFRDISWGVRTWEALRKYRLSWPLFGNDIAFAGVHATTVDGKSHYLKMFHDGKEWMGVGELDDGVEFTDDGMTVASLRWRFKDRNGTAREFSGRPIFRAFIPVDGFLVSENMMEYRLADGTVGYGVCECGFRLPWDGDRGGERR